MERLRKNGKAEREALKAGSKMICYSLENGFSGEKVESPEKVLNFYINGVHPVTGEKTGRSRSVYVTDNSPERQAYKLRYTLHIHSNLWFDFEDERIEARQRVCTHDVADVLQCDICRARSWARQEGR